MLKNRANPEKYKHRDQKQFQIRQKLKGLFKKHDNIKYLLMTNHKKNDFLRTHFLITNTKCPGGETGRRTGLKILGFVNTGVPVQFRPGAPIWQVFEL